MLSLYGTLEPLRLLLRVSTYCSTTDSTLQQSCFQSIVPKSIASNGNKKRTSRPSLLTCIIIVWLREGFLAIQRRTFFGGFNPVLVSKRLLSKGFGFSGSGALFEIQICPDVSSKVFIQGRIIFTGSLESSDESFERSRLLPALKNLAGLLLHTARMNSSFYGLGLVALVSSTTYAITQMQLLL